MSQLGDRLRQLRTERGLTQQELAVRSGLALITVGRAESNPTAGRGPGNVTVSTLEKIAEGLDVPLAALFTDGDVAESA